MKSHILVTDEHPTETQELFLLPEEEAGCVDEQALSHLGYRVEPKSKDETVRDYFWLILNRENRFTPSRIIFLRMLATLPFPIWGIRSLRVRTKTTSQNQIMF